jgi:hypothetical protein
VDNFVVVVNGVEIVKDGKAVAGHGGLIGGLWFRNIAGMSCHVPQGRVLDGKRHAKDFGCLAFCWNVEGLNGSNGSSRFWPIGSHLQPPQANVSYCCRWLRVMFPLWFP